ncbi:cytochrome P450 [Chondromyces crocatus]|uniref:Cytochrome P450 n=1 Tax=Chondromyces crocatus TaxID=52 RepID=A0A0K1EAE9_CHOCO|nr:cytochrome P450 [Chondromyces crocatus]AKT37553.1 cytochrome P450 [Chondromyces crocatus]
MDATSEIGIAPGGLPFLGHALQMLRRPLDFVASLRGQGDVVKIRVGAEWAYLVRHPDLVRQVLTDIFTFDKGGALFDKAKQIVGNGLSTCPASDHLRQRRLLQPAFSRERLENYAATMSEVTREMVDAWQPGDIVDVHKAMGKLALSIATQTLVSTSAVSASQETLKDSIQVLLDGIYWRMIAPFELLQKIPTRHNREFALAQQRMGAVVDQMAEEYRKSGVDRGDLLSALLAARDTDGTTGMTNAEIRDQVLTLFLAGVESNGAAMAWAFYLLGRHPEVERQLHAEVDEVLGGRVPSFADIPKLAVTHRIVQETLRLYPPIWMVSRRTTAAVKLGSCAIPAGAGILFSAYAMHHDPDLFDEPERFDPDRWLPERARSLPREAMLPFSSGKRKCIGEAFSVIEATIAVATVARRFRLRSVRAGTIKGIPRVTLIPGPLPMRVEGRKPKTMA